MKKLLLAIGLVGMVSMAGAHSASEGDADRPAAMHMMMRDHAKDPDEHAAHLQKTLQLSDEQTAKVKKVFEDNAQQRKALDAKYKPQFEAFRADMKKLRDDTHSKLNTILTPKQQQALEAQREHHGGMCPHRKGKGHKHDHDDDQPAAK